MHPLPEGSQRSRKPIISVLPIRVNVNYIVTGGGGGPLYDVGSSWWTVYSEKTYHYCLITANQSKLTCQSIKPDGSIIDSFMITK